MPDLGRRVSKLAAVADRAASWGFARAVLAVVAVQILILAVPSLVAPDESGLVAHDSRHLGTFVIAYAVALVVVVVRPARARSVLPVASVLACALVITAVVDLVNGNVPLLGEALHVPELLSVLMVWVLASPGRRLRPIGSRAPAVELTVVDDARRVGPPEAQLQSPRQAPE
jgi:cytosine/uracil/thiamine/allantoin permease